MCIIKVYIYYTLIRIKVKCEEEESKNEKMTYADVCWRMLTYALIVKDQGEVRRGGEQGREDGKGGRSQKEAQS